MPEVLDSVDVFAAHFDEVARGDGWLKPIRKEAMTRFTKLGFPTTRHEEWRWTNVNPIAQTDFVPAGRQTIRISPSQLAPFLPTDQGEGTCRLVFVNGRLSMEASHLSALPASVKVSGLSEALHSDRYVIEAHLTRHARYDDHAFVALNTALFEDGAFVYVPRNTVVESAIHLVYITVGDNKSLMAHPRNLIVVEPNSQVTVVESYAGAADESYFNNVVTEIVCGDGAIVDHYKVLREDVRSYHIATLQLHLQRNSNLRTNVFSLDGGLVRNDFDAVLAGEGGDCYMYGLSLVGGDRHVDNHLVVEHARPHCHSWEFFKNVLEGRGRGIFSGRIIVREGAQKTDAKQTNMTLLLSQDAQVESRPQLEIFADDVKCTHGATIGQIDEDAMFYLRSRGIDAEAARGLLIYAFARQCLDEVRLEPLRRELERLLLERLPAGGLPQECA